MMPNSLQTRSVVFAYLFMPPRIVPREEASKVHGAVCDALGLDDIGFRYRMFDPETKPRSKGFEILLERKEGRGGFAVGVNGSSIEAPVRLLMTYDWPPSLEHVKERFELAARAVFEKLQGECQKVMAEVRIRAQCDVTHKTGLEHLTDRVLKWPAERVAVLGKPLVFASVKLEVAGSGPQEDLLAGPRREILIEVLREDPRSLYLELMSQWRQVGEPASPGGAIDLSQVRSIDNRPSPYVEEAHRFLSEHVLNLGSEERDS